MKLIALLTITFAITILTSCSSYRKVQTPYEKMSTYNCSGLHMNRAEWHFTDSFGQFVDVTGKCTKGMKNGIFNFEVEGQLVARARYVKDLEQDSECYVNHYSATTSVGECMAQNKAKTDND